MPGDNEVLSIRHLRKALTVTGKAIQQPMGKCKLCLQEKQLLKKSHIIPDFMYQDLYDKNHKILAFNPIDYAEGKGYVKNPSSGEYESGILCNECDNKLLGGLEGYASKAIYGGTLNVDEHPKVSNFLNEHGVELSECENIDYSKWKLFLLSILWRASISSRESFSQVSLGPHENIIREMILTGNPKDISDYPIFTMSYINDKKMPRDLILSPQKRRMTEGHVTYIFPIGGVIYCFYVNAKNHPVPEFVLSSTIRPENKYTIIHLPKGAGWEFILGFVGLKKKPSR